MIEFTGIKFVCEREDGAITTWLDCLDKDPKEILAQVMDKKGWVGGRIVEAYIEFQGNPYLKIWLDVEKNEFNKVIKAVKP